MKYDSALYAQPALITSEPLDWPGLRVERHQLGAMELPAHYHEHHLLLLHQPEVPVTTRRQQGSRVDEGVFRRGDVGLYPGGEYGPVAWNGPTDTVHLYLDNQHLEELARRGLDLAGFELQERFRFEDGLLNQLGQQLLGAIGTPSALGRLYTESLISTLSYHLITHYARYEPRVAAGPRLPGPVLARLEAYLEAHAEDAITLEILAGLANLSVFHFTRRFKLTMGLTPYQYVLTWKIRRAQQLLRAGQLPVAAVGDALGFASPDHFAAAFKRVVGQTPRAFQQG